MDDFLGTLMIQILCVFWLTFGIHCLWRHEPIVGDDIVCEMDAIDPVPKYRCNHFDRTVHVSHTTNFLAWNIRNHLVDRFSVRRCCFFNELTCIEAIPLLFCLQCVVTNRCGPLDRNSHVVGCMASWYHDIGSERAEFVVFWQRIASNLKWNH